MYTYFGQVYFFYIVKTCGCIYIYRWDQECGDYLCIQMEFGQWIEVLKDRRIEGLRNMYGIGQRQDGKLL